MRVTTSTALMLRLLAKGEGPGRMLASVPLGLAELAHRVADPALYGDTLGVHRDRITFVLDPDLWPAMEDVRAIPEEALRKDRDALQEVLGRMALSGWTMNLLSREEFGYLVHCIGEGNWQRGIGYVREDGG